MIGVDLRQVPERPQVDPEDRDAVRCSQAKGAEHRAVATERQDSIASLGQRLRRASWHVVGQPWLPFGSNERYSRRRRPCADFVHGATQVPLGSKHERDLLHAVRSKVVVRHSHAHHHTRPPNQCSVPPPKGGSSLAPRTRLGPVPGVAASRAATCRPDRAGPGRCSRKSMWWPR